MYCVDVKMPPFTFKLNIYAIPLIKNELRTSIATDKRDNLIKRVGFTKEKKRGIQQLKLINCYSTNE